MIIIQIIRKHTNNLSIYSYIATFIYKVKSMTFVQWKFTALL